LESKVEHIYGLQIVDAQRPRLILSPCTCLQENGRLAADSVKTVIAIGVRESAYSMVFNGQRVGVQQRNRVHGQQTVENQDTVTGVGLQTIGPGWSSQARCHSPDGRAAGDAVIEGVTQDNCAGHSQVRIGWHQAVDHTKLNVRIRDWIAADAKNRVANIEANAIIERY